MTAGEDAALIRNFLKGDIASFNRLAWRWQERLFRFAYRYLMDEEEAKDAVQSVLIKAYKNLKKLKDPEKFSTWIYQITVNQCKDIQKSIQRNRTQTVSSDSITDSVQNVHPMGYGGMSSPPEADLFSDNPSESVHQNNVSELVQKTLVELPEEQRIVIIMKEYEGFTFSEIAEFLQVPINTVKSRMYYGLMHTRKLLKKYDIDKEVICNEL